MSFKVSPFLLHNVSPVSVFVIDHALAVTWGAGISVWHENEAAVLHGDILDDSGLAKYFSKVKSIEDISKSYNKDFDKYPHHQRQNSGYKQAHRYPLKSQALIRRRIPKVLR